MVLIRIQSVNSFQALALTDKSSTEHLEWQGFWGWIQNSTCWNLGEFWMEPPGICNLDHSKLSVLFHFDLLQWITAHHKKKPQTTNAIPIHIANSYGDLLFQYFIWFSCIFHVICTNLECSPPTRNAQHLMRNKIYICCDKWSCVKGDYMDKGIT